MTHTLKVWVTKVMENKRDWPSYIFASIICALQLLVLNQQWSLQNNLNEIDKRLVARESDAFTANEGLKVWSAMHTIQSDVKRLSDRIIQLEHSNINN